jgi:hypothetical protein
MKPIEIPVHSIVEEFIYTTVNANSIEAVPDSGLEFDIKKILQETPRPVDKRDKKLDGKIYLVCEDFMAAYATEYHQNKLGGVILKLFSRVFLDFAARKPSQNDKQRKEIFSDFCIVYNLSHNKINEELLFKIAGWETENNSLYNKGVPEAFAKSIIIQFNDLIIRQ